MRALDIPYRPKNSARSLTFFGGKPGTDCTTALTKAAEWATDPSHHRWPAEVNEQNAYFLVKGPKITIPEGVHYYDGPGIDWLSSASTILSIEGESAQISKIAVVSDSFLYDFTKNATAFEAKGITFSGGKGYFRFNNTAVNAVRQSRISDCVFVAYDTCAIGHNSQDWPGFVVERNLFRGTDTSIGVCLSGLAAEGGLFDNVFQRNKYHVKLNTVSLAGVDKGPAVPINIIGNSFFRYFASADTVHDVWITPNADTFQNAGRAILLFANKFGNENLQAGDARILIASADAATGIDACTQWHGSATGGHVNGLISLKNNVNNAATSGDVPYIKSYAELSNFDLNDLVESGQSGPHIAYDSGLVNADFRSESSQNSLSLAQWIGYDASAIARPVSRAAGWTVSDPKCFCLDPSVALANTGGGLGVYASILNQTKTSDFAISGGSAAAIINSRNETGEAIEVTCTQSDGRAIGTLSFVSGRDSEVVWIEGEIAQGSTLPITRVKVDLLDNGGNILARRFYVVSSQWRAFRFPFVHSESGRTSLSLRFVAGDYSASTKTKFQIGRVRVYHSPEPHRLGAVSVVTAPASASAPGLPGQTAFDASWLYTYTGDGIAHSWKRTSIATW